MREERRRGPCEPPGLPMITAVARCFPDCSFGPYRLRRVLRSALAPDERVVGWGTAHAPPTASLMLLRLAVSATPLVGLPLAAVLDAVFGSERRKVLVLTDRRLLAISTSERDHDAGRAISLEAGVEELTVRFAPLVSTFTIKLADGRTLNYAISPSQSRPAGRLCFGLALLDPERAPMLGRPHEGDPPAPRRGRGQRAHDDFAQASYPSPGGSVHRPGGIRTADGSPIV